MLTGGQRCGKSLIAERMAESLSDAPVYVATSDFPDDPDFAERVRRHRERRGSHWVTLEEPLHPENCNLDRRTVLFDCVTLWATNVMFECNEDVDAALCALKARIDLLAEKDATIIMVTNEVGLGGVSGNALLRHFADLQGSVNQYIAGIADEVYLVVSGIPVKIKG